MAKESKRTEGSVIVKVSITAAGMVSDANVLGSDMSREFHKAAIDAATKWTHEPRIVNERAVPSQSVLLIHFRSTEK